MNRLFHRLSISLNFHYSVTTRGPNPPKVQFWYIFCRLFNFKIRHLLYNFDFKFCIQVRFFYIKEPSTHDCSGHRWMEFTIMTTNVKNSSEHKPRSLVDPQISCSVHWTNISHEWQCFSICIFSSSFSFSGYIFITFVSSR